MALLCVLVTPVAAQEARLDDGCRCLIGHPIEGVVADHVFGQRTDDAVATGIDLADPGFVLAGGLDHAAGGGIDDGGHAAGLGIERVLLGCSGHCWLSPWI